MTWGQDTDAEEAATQLVAFVDAGGTLVDTADVYSDGEAERILTLPANLLARFHGLFPGLTTDLLGRVNRLLPAAGAGGGMVPGHEVQERLHSPVLTALTGWGQSAARRFHQYPGPREEATREPTAARSA